MGVHMLDWAHGPQFTATPELTLHELGGSPRAPIPKLHPPDLLLKLVSYAPASLTPSSCAAVSSVTQNVGLWL